MSPDKLAQIVEAARKRLAEAQASKAASTPVTPKGQTTEMATPAQATPLSPVQTTAQQAASRIAAHNAATPASTLSAMSWGKAASAQQASAPQAVQPTKPVAPQPASNIVRADSVALTLSNLPEFRGSQLTTFNPEQKAAIELGLQGKSFCLIGAAGTGKTTVTQELIKLVQRAGHMMPLTAKTKHLNAEAPGIVICGYTNKAVDNIRKKLPPLLQSHCITIHKLLEYAPVYYEVPSEDGGIRTTMRFEPSRNGANPLPHISTIIFEESSMIGTELHTEVLNALPFPSRTQFIYLGDLNQLPPVFGPSILGFKLAELQTVELTHVYRQALESPIISLATDVRTNAQLTKSFKRPAHNWESPDYDQSSLPWKLTEKVTIDRGEHGKLTLHPWKKRVAAESALHMMKQFIPASIKSGAYDPEKDMILCPFNKSFGTIELNNIIADYLTKERGEITHEVIARYNKTYWAVGDRVLVDRHEAIITEIYPTPGYYGKAPALASKTLNRWGVDSESPVAPTLQTADEVLAALDALAGADDDAKNLASHTIKVHIPDLDREEILNTAGAINNMLFGYCLTVHKSQGSEWQRVFLFLHNTHATMLSRELLYTAITRAKHELYIICEGDIGTYSNSLIKGAERPIIPGTTLPEKIAYFREKAISMKRGSGTSAGASDDF
jgi:exodeoxyribonuclease V alpha subunit